MNELLHIQQSSIQGEQIPTTDARQLHAFLESKRDFSNWITVKVVKDTFFAEGQDYILLNNIVEQNGSGGHNRKDYALTLDTAKELSMLERTAKGKQARRYFIECEKIARSRKPALTGSKKEALELELVALENTARMMKFSKNSLLAGIHTVYDGNGVPTRAIPQFTEKVRAVHSATLLLEKNNCGMKIRAFNKLLLAAGYLEKIERLTSKSKKQPYNSVTEKGLKYGQNDAYQGSATKTQAHWFEDTFMELYALAVPTNTPARSIK